MNVYSPLVETYDVLVLGGGTAGTAAAEAAHQAGARTGMLNDGELGGLCILRGCMPTKTMLHAAHLAHHAKHHRTPGVGQADLAIDFAAVMANKDAKVARLQRAKIDGIDRAGYDVIDARGRFTGPDTVAAGGRTYRFSRGAVIATGSVPHVPDIPGLRDVPYWTSDEVMLQSERPETMIVLGTGAVGLELSQFFCRMGTRVQLVGRRRLLSRIDDDVAEELARVIADEPNLELVCPARLVAVRREGNDVVVTTEADGEQREARAASLVVATGRRAALDGLGLEAAGVTVEKGEVQCGTDMRTTNPNIYVAGDASGFELLLHVANWEGRVAGLGAARVPGDHRVEQRLRMQVVFTDPPFATVGITETEARAGGIELAVATARFPETGRAITMDVPHGRWKVLADRRTGEILGSQILGPNADDIVHTLAAVMYYHGTPAQLLEMPWYHPTLSEVLLSLARALQARVETGC